MNRRHPQAGAVHSRRQSAHRRVFTLVIPGLVLCGLTLLLWNGLRSRKESAVPVRIVALDCDLLMADGACYPSPNLSAYRLLITGPQGPLEVMVTGDESQPATERIIDQNQPGSHLFIIPSLPQRNAGLKVSVKSRAGTQTTQLTTFVPVLPGWLKELWDGRYAGRLDVPTMLEILTKHASDKEVQSGLPRSLYSSLKARLLYEREGHSDEDKPTPKAVSALRSAIEAAQDAQVFSELTENALWLAELLSTQLADVAGAEKVMERYAQPLADEPKKRVYYYRQLGLHKGLRGDLHAALQLLVKARIAAQQIADNNGVADVAMTASDFLVQHGRVVTAAHWLRSVDLSADKVCRRQELLRTKLRLALRAREIEPTRALPAGLLPVEQLKQQFDLGQTGCDQKSWFAAVQLDWAHWQLSQGQLQEVQPLISAAVRERAQATWVMSSKHYLEGMLALRQGDQKVAKQHFLALRTFGTGIVDVAAWQAELGLAQVAEARRTAEGDLEALQHYQNAETWVDLHSLSVPLGLGQGTFLGQFERGTRLYLQHLWNKRDLAAALALIRRVRVRGLRELSLLHQLHQDNQQRSAMVSRLTEIRTKLTLRSTEYREAAKNQQGLRESEITESFSELARELNELLLKFAEGDSSWQAELGPPLQKEVLIACHPLPKDWLCLAADANGVVDAQLADADLEPITDADPVSSAQALRLSKALLQPFSVKIEAAQRVSFLTYGKMRRIDLHLLPFGSHNAPLQQRWQVVYSSDVPSRRIARAIESDDSRVDKNRSAYLFFNLGMSTVVSTIPSIKLSLQNLGHSYHSNEPGPQRGLLSKPARNSTNPTDQDHPLQRFAVETANASLLHVITHAYRATEDAPERYLDLGDGNRFYVSDILLLGKVPDWVTLFGCGSAESEEEWGNLDGVGLAHAFLWRGSRWVLGTERTVGTQLGARVSTAFYEELARSGDPFQSLRYAIGRSGVAITAAKHEQDFDLGAFRLYAQ